jgi:hypothetical protein
MKSLMTPLIAIRVPTELHAAGCPGGLERRPKREQTKRHLAA